MNDRNRTIALIGALALVMLIVTGVLWAGLSGRPVDSFLPTLLAFTVPTITSLLTAAGVRRDLEKVQENVNGNLHAAQQQRDDLARQVSELHRYAGQLEGQTQPIAVQQPGRHRPNNEGTQHV